MVFCLDVLPGFLKKGQGTKSFQKKHRALDYETVNIYRHLFLFKHQRYGKWRLKYHSIQTFPVVMVKDGDGSGLGCKMVLSLNLLKYKLSILRVDGSVYKRISLKKNHLISLRIGDWESNDGKSLYMRYEKKNWMFKPEIVGSSFVFKDRRRRDHFVAVVQGLKQKSYGIKSKPVMEAFSDLKVFVSTFNCGKEDIPTDITSWLGVPGQYDLYAIGMQESTYINTKIVRDHIGADYHNIGFREMGEINITVFIRNELLGHVANLETFSKATGIAGIGTNKGGVLVYLEFKTVKLAFINCHLAAHADRKYLFDRNTHLRKIIDGFNVGLSADLLSEYNVFFFGDMNYRLEINREQAQLLADSSRWSTLLNYDQLRHEKQEGRIFAGFEEGDIMFPPSYKYIHFKAFNTWREVSKDGRVVGVVCDEIEPTEFSRLSAKKLAVSDIVNNGYFNSVIPGTLCREYTNKKNRTPSWCDRILMKALPSTHIIQNTYQCCDKIKTSDHSPVMATYDVLVPSFDYNEPLQYCKIQLTNLKGYGLIKPSKKFKKNDKKDILFERKESETMKHMNVAIHDGKSEYKNPLVKGSYSPKQQFNNLKLTRKVILSSETRRANSVTRARMVSDASKTESIISRYSNSKDGITRSLERDKGYDSTLSPLLQIDFPMLKTFLDETTYYGGGRGEFMESSEDESLPPSYVFRDQDIPTIGPFLARRNYLISQTIIIKLISAKRLIGSCPLSLAIALDQSNTRFSCPLLRNGREVGWISGELNFKVPRLNVDEANTDIPNNNSSNKDLRNDYGRETSCYIDLPSDYKLMRSAMFDSSYDSVLKDETEMSTPSNSASKPTTTTGDVLPSNNIMPRLVSFDEDNINDFQDISFSSLSKQDVTQIDIIGRGGTMINPLTVGRRLTTSMRLDPVFNEGSPGITLASVAAEDHPHQPLTATEAILCDTIEGDV